MTGSVLTRRDLMAAMPVLAFLPAFPAQSLEVLPHLGAGNDLGEFFQTLRQMDNVGRANMVAWLRGQDHSIFNALADPVERYCAQLNAADQFRGNEKRVL
ncbi:MAG: hypothetical protein CFE33_01590 [Pseudorhodobacter sp. PARRP1]|nr:MAG: hypothetical protein CFE33_01590 [Pseudorhodobacter sp. PARRP1]